MEWTNSICPQTDGPDVPQGATNARQTLRFSALGLGPSRNPSPSPRLSQLLEAFRWRPQSQRLRIIYMQIHTVQVRAYKPPHTQKQNKEEGFNGRLTGV